MLKKKRRFRPIALLVLAVSTVATGQGEHGIAERLAGRDFPSVFQAWGRVEHLPDVNSIEGIARHDLMWSCPGLRWDATPIGLAKRYTPQSVEQARRIRTQLLKLNPKMILITEIRYRDATPRWLPQDHEWWMRDEHGRIVKGWEEGDYLRLDYKNAAFRRHVARRAQAAVSSGAVDGILLDWWIDDEDRLALVREVRAAIGDAPLILVNSNDRKAPRTAPYVNGFFMECYRSKTVEDWQRIAETLTWAEKNLREPRVNCLEVWYLNSRLDLNLMRAVTTLALTHSDGYCLFSDPNPLPTPDHLHDWYPFWNKSLGKPLGQAIKRPDGATMREFEKGTVVYNPMGNDPVQVTFDDVRTSRATGECSKTHTRPSCDGDIYLKTTDPRSTRRRP